MIGRWRMMIEIAAFVSAIAVPVEAAAATIYGFIQANNQPVRTQEVVLNCQGTQTAKAVTDDRGNYRITTTRTGRCNLVVGDASGDVVLYTEPTQYNFDIVNRQLIRR